LTDNQPNQWKPPTKPPKPNEAVTVLSKAIKNVIASAAEAEIVEVYSGC